MVEVQKCFWGNHACFDGSFEKPVINIFIGAINVE
jgi:hypothetical protein